MNSHEACDAAGITYRMLDFWTRCGLVKATTAITTTPGSVTPHNPELFANLPERWRNPATPGSGTTRDYHPDEVEYLKLMATMSRAGIEPRAAAKYARELVAGGVVDIGGRLVLQLAPVTAEVDA